MFSNAAMRGSISVESSPGHGARFTVVVPVQLLEWKADDALARKALMFMPQLLHSPAEVAASALSEPPPAASVASAAHTRSEEPVLTAMSAATAADAGTEASPHAAASAPAMAGSAQGVSPPRQVLFPRKADGRKLHCLLVGAHTTYAFALLLACKAPHACAASLTRQSLCLFIHPDDHHLNLRLCKRLLELQGGLEVSTADDGDVALQAMIDCYTSGSEPLDFVLMDLQARACARSSRCTPCGDACTRKRWLLTDAWCCTPAVSPTATADAAHERAAGHTALPRLGAGAPGGGAPAAGVRTQR
jgi:hypothetical protein